MATESPAAAPVVLPSSTRRRRLAVFLQLLISFLLVTFIIAAVLLYPANEAWKVSWREQTTRSLAEKARMLSGRISTDRSRSIQQLTYEEAKLAAARATVIDTNGKVIADSEVPLANLEDEGKRPEFVTALQGGTGVEVRSRSQFGAQVIYVAVPLSGGAVRLASPLSDLEIAGADSEKPLVSSIVACSFVAVIASALIAWRLTRP